MREKYAAYSLVCRSAWLAMAVFLIIFCGPVKKLIELRYDNTGAASSLSVDNKLRTGYREKKDIAVLAQSVSYPSPGAGFTLFAASSFVFLPTGLTNPVYFKAHCSHSSVVPGMPLYLRLKKLQV